MKLITCMIFLMHSLLDSSMSFCQSLILNNTIYLENHSTRFREIFYENDDLWAMGEIGIDSSGFAGIFLIKMDTFGGIIESKIYRTPLVDDDLLLSGRDPVIINLSGHIILAGEMFGSRDLFLLSVNKSFDSLLYKEYISNYSTALANNIIELDNNYYISGFVQNQRPDLDALIQKVDYDGNLIWNKIYGTSERTETAHAAISDNGGLTIMITESFDPSPVVKNNTRYWIRFMHIDTSGAIKKDWKEEVTGHEGWSGTLLKYQNDYIYTTNTIGEETNFGPLTGGQIVRRDSAFNIVWRKPLGTPDSQFSGLGDMIFSKDSCLLVTGQNVDSSNQFNAARIMKINLDGELLWEVRDTGISLPNGQSLNIMEGITQSGSGSIYAVGYTYRAANFYEGLLLKINDDGCVDTICTTTAVDDFIRLEMNGMITYPNPVSTHLSIKLNQHIPDNARISIYNFQGIEMIKQFTTDDLKNINVSSWERGMYLVTLHVNGQIMASEKIFVVNEN